MGYLKTTQTLAVQGWTPMYTINFANNASGAPATNRIQNVVENGQTLNHTFDAAGNLTNDGQKTYSYDAVGRMTSVNGGALGTSSYNADGQRVRKVEGGATSYYVYSSVVGGAAFELSGTGTVNRVHVKAGGKEVAQLATDGAFYWLHTDHLGTPRRMTNSTGVVMFRGEYDPHGNPLLEWTTISNGKFTGYERDAAAGLDFAQARHYKFGKGRFMQPDPAGLSAANFKLPESMNRYSYVKNDPVNFVDPSGKYDIVLPWWLYVPWGYGLSHPYTGSSSTPTFLDTILDNLNADIASGLAQAAERTRAQARERGLTNAARMVSRAPCQNFLNALVAKGDAVARGDSRNKGNDFRPSYQPQTDPSGNSSYIDIAASLVDNVRNGAVFDRTGTGRDGNSTTYGEVNTTYKYDPYNGRPVSYDARLGWYPEFYGLDDTVAAQMTIHEGIHFIPGLGDFELAKAAAQLNGEPNRTFANQGAASDYLNLRIAAACN